MIDGMYGYRNFLFGMAYIMIDGAYGGRNFLFGMACVMIDVWG